MELVTTPRIETTFDISGMSNVDFALIANGDVCVNMKFLL